LIDDGDWPASLKDLLKHSKAYPDGYLGESSVPTDGWGRAFRYVLHPGGAYTLYSLGPNGVDDLGAEDDVVP
jgi:hypothetical protein